MPNTNFRPNILNMFGPAAQVKRQAVAYLEPSSRRLPRKRKAVAYLANEKPATAVHQTMLPPVQATAVAKHYDDYFLLVLSVVVDRRLLRRRGGRRGSTWQHAGLDPRPIAEASGQWPSADGQRTLHAATTKATGGAHVDRGRTLLRQHVENRRSGRVSVPPAARDGALAARPAAPKRGRGEVGRHGRFGARQRAPPTRGGRRPARPSAVTS